MDASARNSIGRSTRRFARALRRISVTDRVVAALSAALLPRTPVLSGASDSFMLNKTPQTTAGAHTTHFSTGLELTAWLARFSRRPGSGEARFWPGFPGFPGFWSWIPPGFSPGCRQSWIIIRESGVVSNPADELHSSAHTPAPRSGAGC